MLDFNSMDNETYEGFTNFKYMQFLRKLHQNTQKKYEKKDHFKNIFRLKVKKVKEGLKKTFYMCLI